MKEAIITAETLKISIDRQRTAAVDLVAGIVPPKSTDRAIILQYEVWEQNAATPTAKSSNLWTTSDVTVQRKAVERGLPRCRLQSKQDLLVIHCAKC